MGIRIKNRIAAGRPPRWKEVDKSRLQAWMTPSNSNPPSGKVRSLRIPHLHVLVYVLEILEAGLVRLPLPLQGGDLLHGAERLHPRALKSEVHPVRAAHHEPLSYEAFALHLLQALPQAFRA